MATRRAPPRRGFDAPDDRPLMAVVEDQQGREIIRYFADDTPTRSARDEAALAAALGAIGAFCDLDWDEVQEGLDRIRHESPPTPPINDL